MGAKEGCGSQDGGIDMIMAEECMEEEMLADKMQSRLFLLRIAAALFPGMTVEEFNRKFYGMGYATIRRYFDIEFAVRRQFGEVI